MAKENERRKHPRRAFRQRIDYKAGDGDFLYEYITNISQGGIFIATQNPEPVGTTLALRFLGPDGEESLEVQGEVMWVNLADGGEEHPNQGMGIRFVNLSEEDKDTVSRLVGAIAYL